MTRRGTISSGSDARAVLEGDFPRCGTLAEQLRFLLRYAILAPSTHNTQPWRFVLSPEGIEVYADYRRRLPRVDPDNRELLMSVGAAIFNIKVAASHFEMPCVAEYNTSGDSERPLATLILAPPGREFGEVPSFRRFFSCITIRHTNRNEFLSAPVAAAVVQRARDAVAEGNTGVRFLSNPTVYAHIAGLIADAERLQWADPEFRKDFDAWVRLAGEQDGLPVTALGWPPEASIPHAADGDAAAQADIRALHDKSLCIEAPLLGVLASRDTVRDWVEAGETLEHLLLLCTFEGLHCSYFNMPVQIPEYRDRLRTLVDCVALPQILLRIGYCLTPPVVTSRRPLDEMIVAAIGR